MVTEIPSLADVLRELQARRLILLSSGVIWAPHVPVPRALRRATKIYRRELLSLIASSRVETCPARDLHRAYYAYQDGVFICEMCKRLTVV